ncbi:MAG: hypothetical protein ACKV2V_27845 [Blastocatellia bacterium]
MTPRWGLDHRFGHFTAGAQHSISPRPAAMVAQPAPGCALPRQTHTEHGGRNDDQGRLLQLPDVLFPVQNIFEFREEDRTGEQFNYPGAVL